MSDQIPHQNALTKEQWAIVRGALGPDAERLLPFTALNTLDIGSPLFQEGAHHDSLYLLLDGELEATRTVSGKVISLGVVAPGQWLGEVCVIDRGTATASVSAVQRSTLLELSHGRLVALQHQAPQVAGAVLNRVTRGLAARLRRSTNVIFKAINEEQAEPPTAEDQGWVQRAMSWLLGAKETA